MEILFIISWFSFGVIGAFLFWKVERFDDILQERDLLFKDIFNEDVIPVSFIISIFGILAFFIGLIMYFMKKYKDIVIIRKYKE